MRRPHAFLALLALMMLPSARALTLSLSAAEVASCGAVVGEVTLSEPGETEAIIRLRASGDGARLPDQVTLPPGARGVPFVVVAAPVRTRTTVWITAESDARQAAAPLIVRPPVAYRVEDLGDLGGDTSAATAINASGQVAGVARDSQGRLRGFLTDPAGVMRPIATGAAADGAAAVQVAALNDAGHVAGWLEEPGGGSTAFATDAAGVAVPIVVPGAERSRAYALNSGGGVAGHFTTASGQDRAFWSAGNGSGADLGVFANGSFSYAFALTPYGEVAGYADDANRVYSFLTEPGGRVVGARKTGPHVYAYAVNGDARLVGEVYDPSDGFFHPFRTNAGGAVEGLGRFPGEDAAAWAINTRGDVVGGTYLLGGPEGRAFVFTDALGLRDLNDLIPADAGWELVCARGINDAGQIAGYGLRNGAMRAFRLQPLAAPALYGDADGDGAVTMADVWHILRAASGLGAIQTPQGADVAPLPGCRPQGFGDNRVDILDAVALLRRLAGVDRWPVDNGP